MASTGFPLVLANTPSMPSQIRGMQALEDIQATISTLAENVTPTVVNVSPIRTFGQHKNFRQEPRPKTPNSGSGVIIHEDGYIVTNNHVIGTEIEAEIRFSDHSTLIAQVVGRDPDTDLALLRVEAVSYTHLTLPTKRIV